MGIGLVVFLFCGVDATCDSYKKILLLQTDIHSIRSKPNMRYTKVSGKPFLRKSDYVNSIVRACARKYHFVFFTTCLSKLSLIYYLYFIMLHIKVRLTGPN